MSRGVHLFAGVAFTLLLGAVAMSPARPVGAGPEPDAPIERIVHDEDLVALPSLGRSTRQIGPLEVTASPLTTAPVCDDGASGNRVQAIYVRGASQTSSYAAKVETIRRAMVFSDEVVAASSPGREMHLRMVHSGAPGCVISVVEKVVPDGVSLSIIAITNHLMTQPEFQDPRRKYLAFAEVNDIGNCGVAYSWNDQSPGGGNLNNGFLNVNSATPVAFHATVGKYCWDVSYDSANPDPKAIAAPHEIFHMLGAVGHGAPHATGFGHCTDENDLMCYVDQSGLPMSYDNGCGGVPAIPGTLTNTEPENFLLDCNDDDYFDPSRPVAGYLATSWNTADSDFLYGNEGDRFVALPNPRRAFDSRLVAGRLGPGQSSLALVGNPALGIARAATAVVLNVTAIDPSTRLNVTVWPTGLPKPVASSLNITPGKVIANQVTVKLGASGFLAGSGSISLSTNMGETDIVVDVVGYYVKSRPGTGSQLQPVTPFRVLSSRDAIGPYATPWGPAQTRSVPMPGVPANATAVVLNVTVTQSTAPRSHLRVFPTGQPLPTASSLNFEAGINTPNLVTVGLSGGSVNIYNHAGSVHVIADVVGWFGPTGSLFVPIGNERVLDSRPESAVGPLSRWGPGQTQELQLGGAGRIPMGAAAVVLNLTGVGATLNTNIRVFPAAAVVPDISNLNLVGGGPPRPNAVVVGLSASGAVGIYNHAGSVDLVADVLGYFVPG
jgi:hypothetical protein